MYFDSNETGCLFLSWCDISFFLTGFSKNILRRNVNKEFNPQFSFKYLSNIHFIPMLFVRSIIDPDNSKNVFKKYLKQYIILFQGNFPKFQRIWIILFKNNFWAWIVYGKSYWNIPFTLRLFLGSMFTQHIRASRQFEREARKCHHVLNLFSKLVKSMQDN